MSDSVPAVREKLAELCQACGVRVPEIHLPAAGVDLARFAVVACDQYTSEPKYWEETARVVGQAPSALNLILPEYYLEHPGSVPVETRIRHINETMREYLEKGVLQSIGEAAVVLRRTAPGRNARLGLVLAIDLERYDFTPGNRQLIRATEGTVLDRIPPRVAIRRDAPLELPHVQLLIDDPERTVIEPLFAAAAAAFAPLYDFTLMQGGGHLTGYRAGAENPALLNALSALADLESLCRDGLLFAVGDGNHSLATAKAHYERNKAAFGPDHPARYALVEIINIHDAGLEFEPIHRAVFDIDPAVFRADAMAFFGPDIRISEEVKPLPAGAAAHGTTGAANDSAAGGASETAAESALPEAAAAAGGSLLLPLLQPDGWRLMRLTAAGNPLAADIVTRFLDSLIQHRGGRLDYIHGTATVAALAAGGATGILLPPLDKSRFFATIARDGILPRKTFSMGEAHEKRFYLEARKIV